MSWLESGYPKDVGPNEADDLCFGLLDLSSLVIGDINLPGLCQEGGEEEEPRPSSVRGASGQIQAEGGA